MGIFGGLFGKRQPPQEEQANAEPPTQMQEFWQRAKRVDWEWENPAARALVHEVLTAAAPRFGNAQVKEVPDDQNIDLRGTYDGAPIRFAVWMSFGNFWAIEMRFANQFGGLEIERDHEKIPKAKDASDPWSEDEERRLFLGKGIFVEGGDAEVAEKIAQWGALPDHLQTRVLHDMEALNANAIRSTPVGVSIHQDFGLRDLPDAVEYMESCAALMAELKKVIERTARDPEVTAQVQTHGMGLFRQLTCSYCSSLFIFSAQRTKCPNCGAAASE